MCQRCIQTRRLCVEINAAKQARFLIHNENTYASGDGKRPRGPRSSLLLMQPHFDLNTRALAYYLQYHLQTSKSVSLPISLGGLSGCVYTWKASEKTSPMVNLALSSMALAFYSRARQGSVAATEATMQYCRLLQLTRKQLAQSELDEQGIDACLLAIFLMGRYEAAINPPNQDHSNKFISRRTWNHHDGAMAMLRLWKDNLHPKHATTIIKQARRGSLRSLLLRKLPLPDWLVDGQQFGESGLELEYDRMFVRIANLHYHLGHLQGQNSLLIANVKRLQNEAMELDNAMQNRESRLRSIVSYRVHTLKETAPWPKPQFYSAVLYSYSSSVHAAIWCQDFALKMLIISMRSEILKLSAGDPFDDFSEELQREYLALLEETSGHLASSIPFCLELFKTVSSSLSTDKTGIKLNIVKEIKPYLVTSLVRPLTIASSLEKVDNRRKL